MYRLNYFKSIFNKAVGRNTLMIISSNLVYFLQSASVKVYSGTPLLWYLGDLMKCPVYSGTPLLWYLGDLVKCPVYSGTPLLWYLGDLVKCPV